MAEILKTNKTALRGCILYEFLQGKPVDEAYKSLCKAIGNDVIEYKVFKNWFNCFANGKADLEDESFDKQSLTFSDLPAEILGEIVEKLDLVSRLRTRKVSRTLRYVVDKQKAYYDKIEIRTEDDIIGIVFDDISVDYKNKENGCLIEYGLYVSYTYPSGYTQYERSEDQTDEKFINGNFLEIALNDLEIALKKPKFQLERLDLCFDTVENAVNENVLTFVESLKTPVYVRSLTMNGDAEYEGVRIVSLLKPGKLEEIQFPYDVSKTKVNELVKMQQWQQAKRIEFGGISVRFEECLHFERFAIFVEPVSPQDVIHLRDVLSKSLNFESCFLEFRQYLPNIEEIGRALGAAVVQPGTPRLGRDVPVIDHRYPIPGSNDFLDFKIYTGALDIKKTR